MAQTNDDVEFRRAYSLQQRGQLNEAAAIYHQLIGRNANNALALQALGLVEASRTNFAQARPLMARALAMQPRNVQFAENYATILCLTEDYAAAAEVCRSGLALKPSSVSLLYASAVSAFRLEQPAQAIAEFNRLLLLAPDHVAALNERGSALAALKRYDEALASVEKALALNANYAEGYFNRGNILRALHRHDDAILDYDKAVALRPDLASAWIGRSIALRALKRFEEALAAVDKAMAQNPALADAWLARGNACCELARHEEALAAYDKALALAPRLAEAFLGRGNVFQQLRRFDEAFAAIDKSLALKPNAPEAWLSRAHALIKIDRDDEALAAADRALALDPDFAEAWLSRANALIELERFDEALSAVDRALTLEPDSAQGRYDRGGTLMNLGRPTEALPEFEHAIAVRPDFAEAHSCRIFLLDFIDGAGFAEQQKARSDWWQQVGAPIAARPRPDHANDRDPDRRIRLGYVSGDFRMHSAGYSTLPILSKHDKAKFEITCYSTSPYEDELTQQLRGIADRWREVAYATDDELCELIQADGIDILVDLSGHSAGNRLKVFARKPAPIQVAAWGHATGTGLPTMDYLFSDAIVCPAAVRPLFAERIFDLPCVMPPVDLSREPATVVDPPMLSNDYVTFGMFNRVSKISDEAAGLWARILHAIPNARLLFKHFGLEQPATRDRLQDRFAAHGIGPERLAFLGRTPRLEHIAAFAKIDISVDPFPQNGGASTLESLQLGVPVIAKLGDSISSRLSGSILSSIGLGDWVAETADEYLAIAVKFAAMPDYLKALRYDLPNRLAKSAVGNSAIFTAAIEQAYRKMWTEYCRGAAGLAPT